MIKVIAIIRREIYDVYIPNILVVNKKEYDALVD